jgi:hypothetical protein
MRLGTQWVPGRRKVGAGEPVSGLSSGTLLPPILGGFSRWFSGTATGAAAPHGLEVGRSHLASSNTERARGAIKAALRGAIADCRAAVAPELLTQTLNILTKVIHSTKFRLGGNRA